MSTAAFRRGVSVLARTGAALGSLSGRIVPPERSASRRGCGNGQVALVGAGPGAGDAADPMGATRIRARARHRAPRCGGRFCRNSRSIGARTARVMH
jgi:hypothetical protein